MRYNSHTIEFIILKHSVGSVYSKSCAIIATIKFQNNFITPEIIPVPIRSQSSFIAPLPNWPSLSRDLPILDISDILNHEKFGFLFLISFTEHNVSKVHLCLSVYQYFLFMSDIPLYRCTTLLSIHDKYLGYFYILGIINSATMNIHLQVFFYCGKICVT